MAATAVSTPGSRSAEAPSKTGTTGSDLLRRAGLNGGPVVHLGCGDGRRTAELHGGDSYLVHGLDAAPENVRKAREHIRSLGLYGPVSVDCLHGDRLPYIDNLVNLVVVEALGSVLPEEVRRILAPDGMVLSKTADGWRKSVKGRSAEIDEWTHYLHGPDNNAVAHDAVVGPPRLVFRKQPRQMHVSPRRQEDDE